jgi:hypothetical protein
MLSSSELEHQAEIAKRAEIAEAISGSGIRETEKSATIFKMCIL